MKEYTIDLTNCTPDTLSDTLTKSMQAFREQYVNEVGNATALYTSRKVGYTDKAKPKTSATAYDFLVQVTYKAVDGAIKTGLKLGSVRLRAFIANAPKPAKARAREALQTLSDHASAHTDGANCIRLVRRYLYILGLGDIAKRVDNADVNRILRHAFTLDVCGNGKASPNAVAVAIEDTCNRIAKGREYMDVNELVADIKAERKREREEAKAEAKAEADREKAEAKAEADRIKAEAKAEADRIKAEAKAEADRIKAEANTKAKEAKKGKKVA